MDAISGSFCVALAAFVLALGVVIWSGTTRRRSAHYASVLAMLGILGWAIREAEIMGRGLVFDGLAGTIHKVHFVAVCLTFLLVPLLAWSGVRLARQESPERRLGHRKLASLFVVAVLVTTALGTAMTVLAHRAAAGAPQPGQEATPGNG